MNEADDDLERVIIWLARNKPTQADCDEMLRLWPGEEVALRFVGAANRPGGMRLGDIEHVLPICTMIRTYLNTEGQGMPLGLPRRERFAGFLQWVREFVAPLARETT